jgi:hypothetical protein
MAAVRHFPLVVGTWLSRKAAGIPPAEKAVKMV